MKGKLTERKDRQKACCPSSLQETLDNSDNRTMQAVYR